MPMLSTEPMRCAMRAEQLANVWHLRGSRTSRTSRYYAWTWVPDKLGGGQKAKRASSARDHPPKIQLDIGINVFFA